MILRLIAVFIATLIILAIILIPYYTGTFVLIDYIDELKSSQEFIIWAVGMYVDILLFYLIKLIIWIITGLV